MSATPLKSTRQEAFAILMAEGKYTATAAYRKVTPNPGTGARDCAYKWLTKSDIRARIAHIQQKALEKAEFRMSELLDFGVGLIRLTPEQFSKTSPYAQVVISETGSGKKAKTTKEYRLMDKGKMLALLANVCGYTRSDVKDTADQLTAGGAGRGLHITINLPSMFAEERRLPPRLIELEPPPEVRQRKAKAA